ncbi:MAG TPA: hypothetical protein VJ032_12820, partial [Thermoanaerobaculia bacterium]|nr:hypothetical protein [Thermoanaerobaculia bacterium]
MPWLGTLTIVGLAVTAVLVWIYLKFRSHDVLEAIAVKRRASSKIVTEAAYVEGLEKIAVIVALTDDAFYYENADLQASLDISQIDEVEYDDETATGHAVASGRALRIRSHGHCFEFIL